MKKRYNAPNVLLLAVKQDVILASVFDVESEWIWGDEELGGGS